MALTGVLKPELWPGGQELYQWNGCLAQTFPSSVWGQGHWVKRTAYLGPGPSPPPPRAELTVAGPTGLRTVVVAVFGVHRAGGVVVQGLNTAYGAHLHAASPTALTARLPLTGDPPAGWSGKWSGKQSGCGPGGQ